MNGENEPDKKKLETKDSSLGINFVLGPRDQTQPGSLSLSRSVGTGRKEPWERGWRRQLRKQDLFLLARFMGLALRDKQKTSSMSSKLLHCGCNISIRPSWTLCPVLSCHLVLSDPRFTLNKSGFFTASPFVFSATGPHQIIAKFRLR